jgi:predicted small metal-binding protein
MTMSLACKDTGTQCPYVARGETEDEVLMEAGKHAKAVHGYTEEQLNDAKIIADLTKLIKKG